MTGTGSPGGTEQAVARLGDLVFADAGDVVAMGAHYRPRSGNVSPVRRAGARPCGPSEERGNHVDISSSPTKPRTKCPMRRQGRDRRPSRGQNVPRTPGASTI